MEERPGLRGSRLYRLFKFANWSGIFYFAFVHIAMCMLPVVYNAGMAATADEVASVQMVLRVAKSIAVPLVVSFVLFDVFVTVAWVGMVLKQEIPVPKVCLIFNPITIALLGNLPNLILEGLDSGFESFGWLLMYLVCALALTGKKEK